MRTLPAIKTAAAGGTAAVTENYVTAPLKAPFPYFGGKSRIGAAVWARFGTVRNYVEPFCGSAAVLLARPEPFGGVETVNDADHFIANFWRAVKADPEAVVRACDWPVIETDLHSRHRWLVSKGVERIAACYDDPEHYDAKVAGWWAWGLSCWIGSGWCSGIDSEQVSHLANLGRGVHKKRPAVSADNAGRGVNKLPRMTGNGGGVHQTDVAEKRPALGGDGKGGAAMHGLQSERDLVAWFQVLANRLRRVRVCCGDWTRVLGPTVTTYHGATAIFFDPPYGAAAKRQADIYAKDDLEVADHVRGWCVEHGADPKMRLALCGYEGEHDGLEGFGWSVMGWKASGGYGNRAGNVNAARERVWFSPHCVSGAPTIQGALDLSETEQEVIA